MIFKQLCIELLQNETSSKLEDIFSYRTRKMCHFFERKIKKIKFRSSLKRVVIYITTKKNVSQLGFPKQGMNVSGVFCFYHTVEKSHFESLLVCDEEKLDRILNQVADQALEKISEIIDFPIFEAKKILTDFEMMGFRNEWVHKKVKLDEPTTTLVFKCKITFEQFSLTLEKIVGKGVQAKTTVIEVLPDEIFFDNILGKTEYIHGKVILYSKSDEKILDFTSSTDWTSLISNLGESLTVKSVSERFSEGWLAKVPI